MTKTPIDPASQVHNPAALFSESLALLSSVRNALAELVVTLQDGQLDVVADLGSKQLELEIALRRAMEMERKFNDWNADQGGPAADSIDFDSARNEIGCRLARLRACCRSD